MTASSTTTWSGTVTKGARVCKTINICKLIPLKSPSGIWRVLLGCPLMSSSSAGSAGRICVDAGPVEETVQRYYQPHTLLMPASLMHTVQVWFKNKVCLPEHIWLMLHGSSLWTVSWHFPPTWYLVGTVKAHTNMKRFRKSILMMTYEQTCQL